MLTSQGAGLVDPVGVFIYLFIYSILDSNYVLLLCKKTKKKKKRITAPQITLKFNERGLIVAVTISTSLETAVI